MRTPLEITKSSLEQFNRYSDLEQSNRYSAIIKSSLEQSRNIDIYIGDVVKNISTLKSNISTNLEEFNRSFGNVNLELNRALATIKSPLEEFNRSLATIKSPLEQLKLDLDRYPAKSSLEKLGLQNSLTQVITSEIKRNIDIYLGNFAKNLSILQSNISINITLNTYIYAVETISDIEIKNQIIETYKLQKRAYDLESSKNYKEAIFILNIALERIDRGLTKYTYLADDIRISLGRLHYRINQREKGDQYFKDAIDNSGIYRDIIIFYCAISILCCVPYNHTGIKLLKDISEDSPLYNKANQILRLHLTQKEYFNRTMTTTTKTVSLEDTEMLNRAIYHKIANETSLLRLITSRIARKGQTEELNQIIDKIQLIDEEIKKRRDIHQEKIDKISPDNYEEIINIISKTAHDISDYVNNQLATIDLKIRRYMKKITPDDPVYPKFDQLLRQLTITQNTLNDLKSINEAIKISNNRFYVREIFERWETDANERIKNLRIILNIENAESEFQGDQEKIKSMINELIENSLKHNPDQTDLQITITSKDVINPLYRNIPDKQKFLVIEFSDNGKGIPPDKKDWIFQPLTTTSEKTKGSGLGLFIIRKTLEKMKGHISEIGEHGAKFIIYIPYQ